MKYNLKHWMRTFMIIGMAVLALSACTKEKEPSVIEATPIENPSDSTENTQVEIVEPVTTPLKPIFATNSVLNQDEFMDITTIQAYIETFDNTLIKDIINKAIEKGLTDIQHEIYTNLRISRSQATTGDEALTETPGIVTLTVEGTPLYYDENIVSYRIQGTTDDPTTLPQLSYLNYDLKSGQKIKLFDLISEEDVYKAFESTYQQSYQAPMNSGIFDYWQIDSAYGFTDQNNIEITAPAYYLSYEQTEPVTISIVLEAPVNLELPEAAVVVDFKTETQYTEALNLNYTYPLIQSTADWALALNLEIQSSIDEALDYNVALANEDFANSANANFEWRPYYFNVNYKTFANNTKYISIGLNFYQYTGGAHGLTYNKYFNYNIETGQILTLGSLFESDFDYTTYINDIIYRGIDEMGLDGEGFAFEGITSEQKFYIEGNWLIIAFDPYDIAPYAAGSPTFKVPLPEMQ